ncbi:TrmH family RNA methyltransferase [Prochlorococcus marinus]|uniref:TrmH family RNA methyltransferase n=1 Tax=Prochlorococcus marinus TaxID=1219 RepID=UPI00059B604A|nr:RNA methyltransferase [Prochlorococcus marinus]
MISSRRNPLVRRLRALSTPKGRSIESLLLLEGTHLLEEALKNGSIPEEIIATSKWLENHSRILEFLPKNVQFHLVTASVLQASLTTVTPDGVASLLSLSALPKLKHSPDFILVLDRLQDPGNVGTLFRTALAADIDALWLALGADPLSQKVLRSSAGAVLKLPFERLADSEDIAIDGLVDKLRGVSQEGYQVVATYVAGKPSDFEVIPYWELDWIKPTVLVLGNEGSGLSPRIQACCTHGVTLPHSEAVESLNVAVAAAPLLLERRRAKMTSYMSKNGERSKL